MANVAKDLAQLISQSKSTKTGPYDTQAVVKRIEGNTVWVSIPGGIDETPIEKTINCTAGDKVQVRVSGGRAWITGNASAPPTDDKTANEAKTKAVVAEATAIDAKETADAVEGIAVSASATATTAKTIAEGVNEHFWHDSTGAHVTEVTQDEWNDPGDPNYHSGGNTLITTQGMAIRDGLTNLAQFGSTGAVIGQNASGESRSEISTSGMQIIQNVSGVDTAIANLGYGPGNDDQGGTSDTPYYTLGKRRNNLSSDIGNWSVVEGNNNSAKGYAAHAEGKLTYATGGLSHAEGLNTHATGDNSHAEGDSAYATGVSSHAEGNNTNASGDNSHAQNKETKASSNNQTALGKYNVEDNADTYAVIVGNGTADNARSNALTVEWTGDVTAAGDIEDGSGNVLSNKADTSSIPTAVSQLSNDSNYVSGTGFFQIVQLAVTTTSNIAAHGSYANATYTVPAGDRPAGMTLAGIVGWGASNYRLSPSTVFVNGTHSISVTLANTSATQVTSGATVNFRLLYIKATSA